MTLPVIGAALPLAALADHLVWLRERDRDLELQEFYAPGPLPADWRERVAAAKTALTGWRGRLGIHGPFFGLDLACQDPEIAVVVRRRLDERLDVCAALGADQMVVHSPVTIWDHHNRLNRPGVAEARLGRIEATLRPALRRAEDIGVTLVLENIEDVDPFERRRIVEALDSPALRLSVDTGHAHYAHGAIGGPPVDYYIAAAGDLLDHVHLQDADGYADRHWPPGEGSVPWAAVFGALAGLGGQPRLLLELKDPGRTLAGAAWLAGRGLAV